jgi:L-lactate dehydrogenase complex protein LldG
MSARDEVLGRIRTALAGSPPPPVEVPRAYRGVGAISQSEEGLLDLLEDRLVDYKAGVSRCAVAEVGATVATLLQRHSANRTVVPDGVPEAWLASLDGVEVVRDTGLTAYELDEVDAVLTGCAVAVAETGTIVLDARPDKGRRALSLVPDVHVLVVRSEQVVPNVPDAIARLEPTRPLTWISGPSATSDIELNRVEGVHGPRTLDVLLVDTPSAG